jgi:ribose-phosphate pyrophosphokinase
MENTIIFAMPDDQSIAKKIADKSNIEIGSIEARSFPDGESYIRIDSNVENKTVIIICRLNHPNSKILPLTFMAKTMKELKVKKICLISPYLPYMRQDKRFKPGEAVTSLLFAQHISGFIDSLITIDPHLHRIQHLSEIYPISSISTLHANKKISEWINHNINSPFIIGPDEESRQWVSEIAKESHASFSIIKKVRYGDRHVKISVPEINNINNTPVLVDDIISTGTSMIAVIQELLARGFQKPVCIGVHALFDDMIHNNLLQAGAQSVITCNTIEHPTNKIDVTDILVAEITQCENLR